MEIATALSVCHNISAVLQSKEVEELKSYTKLDGFKSTVSDIIAALQDAEYKQDLPHELRDQIEQLRISIFEADDLFDKLITFAVAQGQSIASRKVLLLLEKMIFHDIAPEVKVMSQKLGGIVSNISLKVDSEPMRKKMPDIYDIFGRQNDKEKIVAKLLHPNIQRGHVSFLTIVGPGGLGKTALAQLFYNDARVTSAFTLRLWIFVSRRLSLDIKELLAKILAAATNQNRNGSDDIHQLERQLKKQLAGWKYLLVLDDVWVDNRDLWHMLAGFLAVGLRGSWIVLTSRSSDTTSIIGDASTYNLEGLSKENSCRLFIRAAFGSQLSNFPDDLAEIGPEIVDGCAGNPLALRVAGSILHGQDKSTWHLFQQIALSSIRESQDDIMPILKISFQHLEPPLKCCFSYCALFPRDFVIEKKMLTSLWMAQGYVIPFDKDQSIDDAAEEYFNILLRRGFFQDAEFDEYGEVVSCKIHDLMHDIAKNVAGNEICITDSVTGNLDERVRHLSDIRSECAQFSAGKTKIRSYLNFGKWYGAPNIPKIYTVELTECKCLRALDLSEQDIKSLPMSIARLLHLRYLNLSGNRGLKKLPQSIGKLINLQTLKLNRCDGLQELPAGLKMLIKLRVMEIKGCYSLTSMPRKIGELICLHSLTDFVIGGISSQSWSDQLTELKALKNLKGRLSIRVQSLESGTDTINDSTTGAEFLKSGEDYKIDSSSKGMYMRNKEHLSHITLEFFHEDEENNERAKYEEALLEELQPHSNIKSLVLCGYHGVIFPSWVTCLPNLVQLHVEHCKKLQYVPYLGNLPHLRVLCVANLINLEYIVEDRTPMILSSRGGMSFFPALERLILHRLPKLKGWYRGVKSDHLHLQCLSKLKSLMIRGCPQLISFPLCPRVETLTLRDSNERLQIMRISLSDLRQLSRSHCFSGRGY